MTLAWDGAEEDAQAARAAHDELARLIATTDGDCLTLGNEFSEVEVRKVHTRNGVRLLIRAPKSEQWVTLDPLELESITWQNATTFSRMIGNPYHPLFSEQSL